MADSDGIASFGPGGCVLKQPPYDPGVPASDIEHGTADCMQCGAEQPSQHVEVRDMHGFVVGRVCAWHTVGDLVLSHAVTVNLRA